MEKSLTIEIVLPKDRSKYGGLTVSAVATFRCLGKADNAAAKRQGNPQRDPLKQYGDTPTGVYIGTLGVTYKGRTYGEFPVIMLSPVSGDALRAQDKGGRSGLWIHGGDPRNGELRPTHGCVRVDDSTQKILVELLKASGNRCEVVVKEE